MNKLRRLFEREVKGSDRAVGLQRRVSLHCFSYLTLPMCYLPLPSYQKHSSTSFVVVLSALFVVNRLLKPRKVFY